MRVRCLIAAIVCLPATIGSAARAAPADAAAGGGGALVTSTRQNAFTIPFRIEPPATPSQQPVEVQLHASTNGGSTWELAGRVKPEKGSFVFRAPRDGEYWYSIRTVDAQGTVRPEGTPVAQLKVTVDTVAPRLELTATRGAAGEIVARWQAVDPHLKLASFQLEYQASSTDPWERVAVESPPPAMRHTFSGETTWWPSAASGSVVVRAEVTDEAGNPAVSQAFVKPPAPAAPGEVTRSLTPEQPRAEPQRSGPTRPDANSRDTTRWTADRLTNEPLGRATGAEPAQARDANWRTSGGRDPRSAAGQGAFVSPANDAARGGPPGSPLDFGRLPPGQRPRMINSRNFELEYEIDAVGPSGVSRVELWGTRDGGTTWSVFGVDPDHRSPMPVSLDGEGIFGFRVVIHSGNGLGGRPPAAGDAPDIWIGVDLTKPTCRITKAEVAAEAGELAIGWEALDEVPDARPIAILFSPSPAGPWTPVAAGLENSGTYRWRLDERVPDRVFLRLEVRDEAGNVGGFDTAEPVSLDRHRPEGRIRGVRPLGS